MLAETMGAEGAFERRRWELSELGRGAVSDVDVAESFVKSVTPGDPDAFMLGSVFPRALPRLDHRLGHGNVKRLPSLLIG